MFVAFFGYFVLSNPTHHTPCYPCLPVDGRCLRSSETDRHQICQRSRSVNFWLNGSTDNVVLGCNFSGETWMFWRKSSLLKQISLQVEVTFLSTEVDSVSAIIAQIPDLFLAWHLSLRSCKTDCWSFQSLHLPLVPSFERCVIWWFQLPRPKSNSFNFICEDMKCPDKLKADKETWQMIFEYGL